MTDNHPITPPPELVQQWRDLPEYTDGRRKMIMVTISREKLLDIATQAARWGADQELEACKQVILDQGWFASAGFRLDQLHNARRPKPPSHKELALIALTALEACAAQSSDTTEAAFYIRRALEQLDD